ncbi:unnamed protein product [Lepidochelys kempii]
MLVIKCETFLRGCVNQLASSPTGGRIFCKGYCSPVGLPWGQRETKPSREQLKGAECLQHLAPVGPTDVEKKSSSTIPLILVTDGPLLMSQGNNQFAQEELMCSCQGSSPTLNSRVQMWGPA